MDDLIDAERAVLEAALRWYEDHEPWPAVGPDEPEFDLKTAVEALKDERAALVTGMDDLATWLRAQLDDDERVAQAVLGVNAVAGLKRGVPAPRWETPEGTSQIRSTDGILRVQHTWAREAEHIARWDPARVLAEVEAKRKLLNAWADQWWVAADIARMLALPYADRDGYREEWRP